MKKGILIYAYNSPTLDYALMGIISGGLAKKNLGIPASLVSDQSTIEWMEKSGIYKKALEVFEQVIISDRPDGNNLRRLNDGTETYTVPFLNSTRYTAWNLSPYDKTLLIDSDFLIFSNRLNEFWDVDQDILIGDSIKDIYDEKRLGYHDRYISDTGIKMYWATTVMFTKSETSKLFFDLVNHVKEYYTFYSDVYRFDHRQYRNDIAFSIAKHILNGFIEDDRYNLPPVLTALDKDILYEVNDQRIKLLVNHNYSNGYIASSLKSQDLHVMNKQSIIRNKDKLLELI